MWWILGGGIALVFLGVVALVLGGIFFSSDRVERYPSGRVRARGPHYRGDRQDLWTLWHEEGWLECEGKYVGGFESGSWTF